MSLAALVGFRQDTAGISSLLQSSSVSPDVMKGLAAGLNQVRARRLVVPAAERLLGRWIAEPSDPRHALAWELVRYLRVPRLTRRALSKALDDALPVQQRLLAVRGLAGADPDEVIPVVRQLLAPSSPVSLQLAVIDIAADFDRAAFADILLAQWDVRP